MRAFISATFFITAISALWGLSFRAQADCVAHFSVSMYEFTNSVGWSSSYTTNVDCGVGQETQSQFVLSSNAIYGYYWFNRNINTNDVVIDTCYLAGAANAGPYNGADDPYGNEATESEVTEDVLVQFMPTTNDETAPTSISFQGCYHVQGQITGQYDPQNRVFFSGALDVDGDTFLDYPTSSDLQYTLAITIPVSTNVLGSVMSGWSIGQSQALELYRIDASDGFEYPGFVITNAYGEGYDTNFLPTLSYNISCSFLYFTNIVDQSNNPVSLTNLNFWCVDPNDTNNLRYTLIQPAPNSAPLLSAPLQVSPYGTNLIIEWPLYGSNFQLQKTFDLSTREWTTNGLPAPVQVGAFLQVSIPMTNVCEFFRIAQLQ